MFRALILALCIGAVICVCPVDNRSNQLFSSSLAGQDSFDCPAPSKDHKVGLCSEDDGEYKYKEISQNAVDSHMNAHSSGPFPDIFPGNVNPSDSCYYDCDCDKVEASVPTLSVFGVETVLPRSSSVEQKTDKSEETETKTKTETETEETETKTKTESSTSASETETETNTESSTSESEIETETNTESSTPETETKTKTESSTPETETKTKTESSTSESETTKSSESDSVPPLSDFGHVIIETNEDEPVALNLQVSSTGFTQAQSLVITITGAPTGATLQGATGSATEGWTVTPENLPSLTLTPPPNSDEDFDLLVSAVATLECDGSSSSSSLVLAIRVNGVADLPTLSLSSDNGDYTFALSAVSADTDGSESFSFHVSGDASFDLSVGTKIDKQTWSVDGAQASITVDFDTALTLTVTAVSTEECGGSTASGKPNTVVFSKLSAVCDENFIIELDEDSKTTFTCVVSGAADTATVHQVPDGVDIQLLESTTTEFTFEIRSENYGGTFTAIVTFTDSSSGAYADAFIFADITGIVDPFDLDLCEPVCRRGRCSGPQTFLELTEDQEVVLMDLEAQQNLNEIISLADVDGSVSDPDQDIFLVVTIISRRGTSPYASIADQLEQVKPSIYSDVLVDRIGGIYDETRTSYYVELEDVRAGATLQFPPDFFFLNIVGQSIEYRLATRDINCVECDYVGVCGYRLNVGIASQRDHVNLFIDDSISLSSQEEDIVGYVTSADGEEVYAIGYSLDGQAPNYEDWKSTRYNKETGLFVLGVDTSAIPAGTVQTVTLFFWSNCPEPSSIPTYTVNNGLCGESQDTYTSRTVDVTVTSTNHGLQAPPSIRLARVGGDATCTNELKVATSSTSFSISGVPEDIVVSFAVDGAGSATRGPCIDVVTNPVDTSNIPDGCQVLRQAERVCTWDITAENLVDSSHYCANQLSFSNQDLLDGTYDLVVTTGDLETQVSLSIVGNYRPSISTGDDLRQATWAESTALFSQGDYICDSDMQDLYLSAWAENGCIHDAATVGQCSESNNNGWIINDQHKIDNWADIVNLSYQSKLEFTGFDSVSVKVSDLSKGFVFMFPVQVTCPQEESNCPAPRTAQKSLSSTAVGGDTLIVILYCEAEPTKFCEVNLVSPGDISISQIVQVSDTSTGHFLSTRAKHIFSNDDDDAARQFNTFTGDSTTLIPGGATAEVVLTVTDASTSDSDSSSVPFTVSASPKSSDSSNSDDSSDDFASIMSKDVGGAPLYVIVVVALSAIVIGICLYRKFQTVEKTLAGRRRRSVHDIFTHESLYDPEIAHGRRLTSSNQDEALEHWRSQTDGLRNVLEHSPRESFNARSTLAAQASNDSSRQYSKTMPRIPRQEDPHVVELGAVTKKVGRTRYSLTPLDETDATLAATAYEEESA